jgi:hypothetical protein
MIAEYQVLFQQQSYKHFEPLIEDYNKLISSQKLVDSINGYLEIIGSGPSIDFLCGQRCVIFDNSESVRGYYFLFLSSQLNFE